MFYRLVITLKSQEAREIRDYSLSQFDAMMKFIEGMKQATDLISIEVTESTVMHVYYA